MPLFYNVPINKYVQPRKRYYRDTGENKTEEERPTEENKKDAR